MALPAWEAAGDGDVKHQKVLLLLKAGNTEEEVAVAAYAPVLSNDWGTAPVPGVGASPEAMGFSIPFLQDVVGQSGALTFLSLLSLIPLFSFLLRLPLFAGIQPRKQSPNTSGYGTKTF